MTAGFLVMAALAFGHPVAANAAPTFEEVRGKLATAGPRATVQDLHAHGRFDGVLTRISGGDRAWIGLAPRLAQGADGADSEGLGIALAEALPKKARLVVATLDLRGPPSLRPSRVCGAPFIEPKDGVVRRWKAEALSAVLALHEPALAGKQAACLDQLKAVHDG